MFAAPLTDIKLGILKLITFFKIWSIQSTIVQTDSLTSTQIGWPPLEMLVQVKACIVTISNNIFETITESIVLHAANIHLLRTLSSYQKKDWRGPTHPSFFRYDNKKDSKRCVSAAHA